MDDRTSARERQGKKWRRVLSTNFIQFQPHYLHIYVESGISRWRNTPGVAPSTSTWGGFGYFLRFRLFQIPVSAPSIKWPSKVKAVPLTFTPVYWNVIMPSEMPEYMSDRMSEYVSDRLP